MVTELATRMPGRVKWALAGVWFQVVSNILVGIWLQLLVNDRLDHGQDVSSLGLVRFSIYLALVAGVALLFSAVCALRRFSWAGTTILVVECAYMLIILINIFVSGLFTQAIGLVIAFAVSRTVLSEPGREWFSR